MKIIFVDKLPDNQTGFFVDYEFRKFANGDWKYCDLKEYFKNHQNKFLEDIENWHIQLSQNALKYTSWWWLLPASRLISWSPPVFNPLFFTVALIDYCESRDLKCLYLRGIEKEVYFYLKEFKPQWKISFASKNSRTNFLNIPSGGRLILFLRKFLSNGKLLLLFISEFIKSRRNSLDACGVKTIVFSFFLGIKIYEEKGDHFFGRMFDEIKDKEECLLWVYHGDIHQGQHFLEKIKQEKNKKAVFLLSFLAAGDLIKIICISLRLFFSLHFYKNKMPPIFVNGYCSKIFTKIFYRQIIWGSFPIYELAAYFSMKRLLKKSQARNFIYPYEEKGLERAILLACQKFSQHTRTVGFAHAVYNPGFLYLRMRLNPLANPPKPDVFATAGPALGEWFSAWAKINPQKIKTIGSPRHQAFYLEEKKIKERKQLLKVLILTGHGHEMIVFANWVEEYPNLFDQCQLLIRPYPFDWKSDQKKGLERIKKVISSIQIESKPLLEQFKWADVVIYSSTSAGIEAMLNSRIAIYVDLHDKFILNPIEGKGDALKIFRCLNCEELKHVLTQIRKMSNEEYLQTVKSHYEFAKQIYSPLNYENLESIFAK